MSHSSCANSAARRVSALRSSPEPANCDWPARLSEVCVSLRRLISASQPAAKAWSLKIGVVYLPPVLALRSRIELSSVRRLVKLPSLSYWLRSESLELWPVPKPNLMSSLDVPSSLCTQLPQPRKKVLLACALVSAKSYSGGCSRPAGPSGPCVRSVLMLLLLRLVIRKGWKLSWSPPSNLYEKRGVTCSALVVRLVSSSTVSSLTAVPSGSVFRLCVIPESCWRFSSAVAVSVYVRLPTLPGTTTDTFGALRPCSTESV